MALACRALVPVIALVLAVAAPAAAQTPDAVIPATGAEYVSSDNVELVGQIKTVGDGVGAKIVGNTMFVTSTKSLSIFDITDGEHPKPLGIQTLDVEWENEEVPTNGKLLGISASSGCKDLGTAVAAGATDCLNLYDVSDRRRPSS